MRPSGGEETADGEGELELPVDSRDGSSCDQRQPQINAVCSLKHICLILRYSEFELVYKIPGGCSSIRRWPYL